MSGWKEGTKSQWHGVGCADLLLYARPTHHLPCHLSPPPAGGDFSEALRLLRQEREAAEINLQARCAVWPGVERLLVLLIKPKSHANSVATAQHVPVPRFVPSSPPTRPPPLPLPTAG